MRTCDWSVPTTTTLPTSVRRDVLCSRSAIFGSPDHATVTLRHAIELLALPRRGSEEASSERDRNLLAFARAEHFRGTKSAANGFSRDYQRDVRTGVSGRRRRRRRQAVGLFPMERNPRYVPRDNTPSRDVRCPKGNRISWGRASERRLDPRPQGGGVFAIFKSIANESFAKYMRSRCRRERVPRHVTAATRSTALRNNEVAGSIPRPGEINLRGNVNERLHFSSHLQEFSRTSVQAS